jgi:hypothetical protein
MPVELTAYVPYDSAGSNIPPGPAIINGNTSVIDIAETWQQRR